MTTETPIRLLTAEEFWELPDPVEGGKMELVGGRVIKHMPVGGPHGQIVSLITFVLVGFTLPRRLGAVGSEIGFVLSRSPDVVRAPDVHFVRQDRLVDGWMPNGFFVGAPDLAIEVISPDDRDSEVALKVRQYRDAGVARVWLVRPEDKSIMVFRPDSVDDHRAPYTLNSDDAGFDIEGFELSIDWLFEKR